MTWIERYNKNNSHKGGIFSSKCFKFIIHAHPMLYTVKLFWTHKQNTKGIKKTKTKKTSLRSSCFWLTSPIWGWSFYFSCLQQIISRQIYYEPIFSIITMEFCNFFFLCIYYTILGVQKTINYKNFT